MCLGGEALRNPSGSVTVYSVNNKMEYSIKQRNVEYLFNISNYNYEKWRTEENLNLTTVIITVFVYSMLAVPPKKAHT